MRTPLRIPGAIAAIALAAGVTPFVLGNDAHAAGFTGGDLVVYRVGTAGGSLTNAAAPVFLDELGPTGAPIHTIALPTAASQGNSPLTATGQSRSEGLVARSADGRFLAVTGYAATPGTPGPGGLTLTASDPATVGRVVGLVDANGTVDTSTVLHGATAPKIIRSAVTDGDRIWATGGNGGIATTTLGSSTVTTAAGDADTNLTSLTAQGGQVFASGILADRLASVGSGGSLTSLTGLPDNLLTYGYAFEDLTAASYAGTGLDTLYLANASTRAGTVDKYRFDGTTWSLAGQVDVPGAFGLVADRSGSTVSLAVTTPTQLISLTDSSAAGSGFATGAPTVLSTAAAGTEYRGVALAPTAPAGPSIYVRTPATGDTLDLSAGTATVTAYVDSPAGVGSVEARLGDGSFVQATRTGKLWTATVSTAGLTPGASTLTVKATDQAATPATTTVTRAVQLSGTGIPKNALTDGTYAWSSKKVTKQGTWVSYSTKRSPSGKGLKSKAKGSLAKATTWGHGLAITFDRTGKGGKVKVTVDGRSTTYDLYKPSGKPLVTSWSFSGPIAAHKVVVTVLGKKSADSAGTFVYLAALKVKP